MNKTILLKGLRWMFLLLVAFVIFAYMYKRLLLHSDIQSSIHLVAPDSAIVGIIQTQTANNGEKVYHALYKTTEGKCFRASFERKSYILIENRESSCQ
ncbi:hypothetical protein [Rossellomorea arthrocnemi]|jgi:hypothetical protein|uniref:hypothetical protein n=1 Tax=Rossellomorea arthrocnemi TaxID=2769542 RepID=UPI001918AF1C|nr:hypothetical protein [Rossellomorea arthrocnemi]